jgi:hypothetical protein
MFHSLIALVKSDQFLSDTETVRSVRLGVGTICIKNSVLSFAEHSRPFDWTLGNDPVSRTRLCTSFDAVSSRISVRTPITQTSSKASARPVDNFSQFSKAACWRNNLREKSVTIAKEPDQITKLSENEFFPKETFEQFLHKTMQKSHGKRFYFRPGCLRTINCENLENHFVKAHNTRALDIKD